MRSYLLFASCLLLLSCGGPAERIRETSQKTPTASPSPVEREMSGTYELTGAGNTLEPGYEGVLTITNEGEVLAVRRQTNKGTTVGTGIQLGESIAVSYAAAGSGQGCGVGLYKIASDGSFEGKIVRWGETKFGRERAKRIEGRNFPGKYDVSGSKADGTGYEGKLLIVKDGEGYGFAWEFDEPQVGFAYLKGSYTAVTFGGHKCSFALYSITGPNSLEGTTGGQKAVTFGTETAKRR
jgi:hypothetical protein